MRWILLAVAFFAVPGCLSVDSPDGALTCSANPQRACPEGFYCLAADNTCWRYGHFPVDMATPMQFFPGGPDDLSFPVFSDLSPADGGDDLMSTPPADLASTD